MVGLGPQDRTRVCELPPKANRGEISSKKFNVKIILNNSNTGIIDQGYVSTFVEVEKEVFQTGHLRLELPDESKNNTKSSVVE